MACYSKRIWALCVLCIRTSLSFVLLLFVLFTADTRRLFSPDGSQEEARASKNRPTRGKVKTRNSHGKEKVEKILLKMGLFKQIFKNLFSNSSTTTITSELWFSRGADKSMGLSIVKCRGPQPWPTIIRYRCIGGCWCGVGIFLARLLSRNAYTFVLFCCRLQYLFINYIYTV